MKKLHSSLAIQSFLFQIEPMKILILGLLLSTSAFAIPDNNWIMRQVWSELSFTHYEVDENERQKLVPRELKIDKYQGRAFVGIVTLEMTKGNLNGIPLSLYNPFPQVNVRTYVTCNGNRGIYFLNIDADHFLGPAVAKTIFALPYHKADIQWKKNKDEIYVLSEAKDRRFEISYRPLKETIPNEETRLEIWLTDIYRSYQLDRNKKVQESKLWHSPFVVQEVDAKLLNDEAFQVLGLNSIEGPSFHYVKKTETFFWKNKEVKCN